MSQMPVLLSCTLALIFLIAAIPCVAAEADATLPDGVKAVWDLDKAQRETTLTRERICINGLWRWQPAANNNQVPKDNWGYFKVPGRWPGYADYVHAESQTHFPHPTWKEQKLAAVNAAWHQREFIIPIAWTGRKILLETGYLNSFAKVFVDGKHAGELRFPGGELDITSLCRPGQRQELGILVIAMPLKAVIALPIDEPANTMTGSAYKGNVLLKGLCGDCYITSIPAGARLGDFKIATSTRKGEISFDLAVQNTTAGEAYNLHVKIDDNGRESASFKFGPFKSTDLKNGRITFSEKWLPEKLWNVHTPQNMYRASVSLLKEGAGDAPLDTAFSQKFGFREFWIDGRDFYINGAKIQLCFVPIENMCLGSAWASYDGAKETMLRLMSSGANATYTHNYGCAPGDHLSYEEFMRAADDVGMLVSLSVPNAGAYDWTAPDADLKNGFADHSAFYTRAAANHPSVVFYSMHFGTPYLNDMNPDMIDGIQGSAGAKDFRGPLSLRAEGIVKQMDPTRIVYHHAAGNLGAMHTSNFYTNFAPIQELSDWFEHWATKGVKPVFTCEYGAPFSWDWSMFRGIIKGTDRWQYGGTSVQWEFCQAEWNSQFFGDPAFKISEMEKKNLRFEAAALKNNNAAYKRWSYPHQLGGSEFDERQPVYAAYFTDNWRAFRTWGVSAISPWEYNVFWKLRPGVGRGRKNLPTNWDQLQRPGYSADFVEPWYEIRWDFFHERSDWIATPAAEALIRNSQPLLAYIGGKSAHFTSKDHNFIPGESIDKQLIIINNHRETVACECEWMLNLPQAQSEKKTVSIKAGEQARIPLTIALPGDLAPGKYELSATVKFDKAPLQNDVFTIQVLPKLEKTKTAARIALFDPKGETAKELDALGVKYKRMEAKAPLADLDLLVIGKGALTPEGEAPDMSAVAGGLRAVIFEQTKETMERRLGFRVAEYGLRQVFSRIPDHPVMSGLESEHLRDWRGEATLAPSRLAHHTNWRGPHVNWCDSIEVPQIWRVGNWGSVATVLPEKPACGDFLPLVDGGFSLQYSPLMEFREGKGMIVFCQLDVTGRTDRDPVASRLISRIMEYAAEWKPKPARQIFYAGEAEGRKHLEQAGFALIDYAGGKLATDGILVVGPGGGRKLESSKQAVADWLGAGGELLAIGIDQEDADAVLPVKTGIKKAEHIAACFDQFTTKSLLTGVGPADVHNRDPRELNLVSSGATVFGNGVIAKLEKFNVVFCQMPPWQFTYSAPNNTKRTFRRAACMVTRLLTNMGGASKTPLLSRLNTPVTAADRPGQRCLNGLYLDAPEAWDYPYRFMRW